ncbi:MAG: (d)CMP kinase [Gemmatimonadota bacterium]
MIVAIDGPAGSGKSSTARAVADRLGFRHLDSGAWYRALTLCARLDGIPAAAWSALEARDVAALGVTAEPSEDGFRLLRRGVPIPDEDLRAEAVTAQVSLMASLAPVRAWLLERQREQAAATDVVVDGRDIGTVVFPDAELKVYLDAYPHVRALRRLLQRDVEEPSSRQIFEEAARLKERDRRDAGREIAPLRRAPDAVLVDTSDLTFHEQVDAVVELARKRLRGLDPPGHLSYDI